MEENREYKFILDTLKHLSEQIDSLSRYSRDIRPSRSPELKDLFEALSKSQAEMPLAGRNSENPYFKSRYADFAEIVRVSRPCLTKNGLSVLQQIEPNEDGQNILYTILSHSSGQWIESRMRILPAKPDVQSLSSYITYIKRIAYASLVGVAVTNEDDDGEIAMVESRDILAKGPTNKYNPKEETYTTISKDQLDELEYELAEYPDLADEVMTKLQIQSLADMPKSKYMISLQRIREIKMMRNTGKKI